MSWLAGKRGRGRGTRRSGGGGDADGGGFFNVDVWAVEVVFFDEVEEGVVICVELGSNYYQHACSRFD